MYIIAEVAQAHDGSLGNALSFVDAASELGIDAVKFQLHIAEEESTTRDSFRVNAFPQDADRFSYWKRTSFTYDQWHLISNRCRSKNIDLIVSPFSMMAVDICLDLNVSAFKIGSGEFFNIPLVDKCLTTGKKIIISTGLSSWSDIDQLMYRFSRFKNQIALLHCVTKYPCPLEEAGLNNVLELKARYDVDTGLSDHSGDLDVALVSAARQFEYYEAHICWSKMMFGPDTSSSLTVNDFEKLAKFNVKVSKLSTFFSKDIIADSLRDMKQLFGRSLVASVSLPAGSLLQEGHIAFKKPGGGLSWQHMDNLVGRRLINKIEKDEPFDFGNLE